MASSASVFLALSTDRTSSNRPRRLRTRSTHLSRRYFHVPAGSPIRPSARLIFPAIRLVAPVSTPHSSLAPQSKRFARWSTYARLMAACSQQSARLAPDLLVATQPLNLSITQRDLSLSANSLILEISNLTATKSEALNIPAGDLPLLLQKASLLLPLVNVLLLSLSHPSPTIRWVSLPEAIERIPSCWNPQKLTQRRHTATSLL